MYQGAHDSNKPVMICTLTKFHSIFEQTYDIFSMINVNLCIEVRGMFKRLWFLIDDIHEMNQIVLSPYSYPDWSLENTLVPGW